MRIVAIDASRRTGFVSTSVETAARAAEDAGAQVVRVRLRDTRIRTCTGCGMCHVSGSCKIDDDLPELAHEIADADGVIFGTPSYFRQPDDPVKAIIDRLGGYFRSPGEARRAATGLPRVQRAIIITACIAPEPLATFFGYTTGPIRELRRALGSGGFRTIGSLAVTDTWRRPSVHAWERDKAASLGRVLAGKI